jgi:uncharacterized protein YciI
MARQFVFFYIMKDEEKRIRDIIPAHVGYWKKQLSANHAGGPFSDRSGGMILFEAMDHDSARQLTHRDPFVIEHVIEKSWIKEWLPNRRIDIC